MTLRFSVCMTITAIREDCLEGETIYRLVEFSDYPPLFLRAQTLSVPWGCEDFFLYIVFINSSSFLGSALCRIVLLKSQIIVDFGCLMKN